MSDELDFTLEVAKDSMIKAITHLENELTKIRAGKANPQMLEGVTVDYYGVPTIISQMANVSAIDARTLTIQPWEKNMLQPIERAIINANLGVTPQWKYHPSFYAAIDGGKKKRICKESIC
jgi:ribosome recycling factor